MKTLPRMPWLRGLGRASVCAGALALTALFAAWPRILAWATRHLSRDRHVTAAGAAQLALLLAAACAALIAGGWLLERLATDPGARGRLLGQTPEQAARGYLALAWGWAAAIVAVGGVALFGRDERVSGETGIVETAQLLVLLAAALVLGRTARAMGLRGGRGLTHALLAAAALLVAGEEISWGQWYLRWQTPAAWAAVNQQRETNVHNLFNTFFEPAYVALGSAAVLYLALSTVLLASRYGGSRHAWLLLRPEASGPVAAMAIGLLRGGLGSTPHWFELEELAAYLTLLVWAHGNLRAVTMAPWHAQRTADSVAASPRRWPFSPPPLPPPS